MEDLDTKAPNIHELNTEISSLLLNIHEVMTRLFLVIKQRILYVVILLCMLQLLLWMAIFLYATFYYTFMPRATFSTPIHFYYSSDYCSFPVANFSLLQNGKTQVMAHGQPYRITLELEMPESPANMQLGMFLVKMSCYSHDQQIVDTSVRSAMLRYRSELLQTLETAMFIPLMLMGAFEQKQQILVELYSSYTDSSNKPTIGAIIEIQSLQVQIYKAQLHIHAHFSGIRYILYHFPLTASVVGVMSNFIFLSALFLMSYLRDGLGSIWMNLTSEEWNKIIEWTTDTQETTSQYERSTHTAESDEVFSEGEDMAKRKNKKRCRSWRTFLTMLQWSKRRQNSWVQLAGHQGNIQPSEGGEVLKRFNEVEDRCLQMLMSDPLQTFVPQYYGNIIRNGEKYIRLQDLLNGLKQPAIMDCKIGVRTYQEDEIINARAKSSMRPDMYQKMVKIDPMAPTEEEHAQRGVTKLRYMQWRDNTSSTSTLGFRIEGIMMDNGTVLRDFNKTRCKAHITEKLLLFTNRQVHILKAYLSRLEMLKKTLTESAFFSNHEVIGSSLLFVHDCSTSKANIWMIDFGKTVAMPENTHVKHEVQWVEGNHEDGYLIGLESLNSVLHEAIKEAKGECSDSHHEETELSSDTVKHPQPEIDEEASQTC